MNELSAAPLDAPDGHLQLGGCVLDLPAGELRTADGELAGLRRQALAVLLLLGSRAGQVVGKDELMRQVWPNVVVGDGSLTQAVVDIRRVLGDHEHRLVRNIARRGYMLVPDEAREGEPELVAGAASAHVPAAWALRRAIAWPRFGALIIGLALALAAGLATRSREPGAAPKDLSIVVLPLTAEGGGADLEALADVLHDDLIAEASRLEASVVIARGTAATYRSKVVDPRTVARELNVRHVVGGSLRRDGERLRLALTLSDGDNGIQRWAEVFEFERPQMRSALDDVVAQLARALYVQAWKSAAVRANALSPAQVTADDLATRAIGQWFRGLNRDNVLAMLSLGEQAVAADPDSVRGWSAIATGNVQALNNDWIVESEARASARERAAQASAALDRLAPDGFSAMQARVIEAYNRQDFPTMLQRSRQWVERHRHPVACGALGAALYHNDRPEEAMPWLELALRLSPRDPFRAEWMYRLAWAQYMVGNFEQSLHWARTAQATNPLLPWPPVQAAALLRLGRSGEAQASWEDFHRRHARYDSAAITRRLGGEFPRFAAARARLMEDLRKLGMT